MASQKYPTNKTQKRATKAVIVCALLLKRRTSDETEHKEEQGTVTRGKRRRKRELKEIQDKQAVRRMNRIIKVKKYDDFEYETNRVKVKIDRRIVPFKSDKGENNNMNKRCKSASPNVHKVTQLRKGNSDSGNLNDEKIKRTSTEGLDNLVTAFSHMEKVGKRRNRKSFEVDIDVDEIGTKTDVSKIGNKTESTSKRMVRKMSVEGTDIEGDKTETVETSTSKRKIMKIDVQATEDMDGDKTEIVEANTSKRKVMKKSIETPANKNNVKTKAVEANTGRRNILKICVQHTGYTRSDKFEAVAMAKANKYKRSARNIKKNIDDNFVYDNTDETGIDAEPDESELNTSGSSLGEEIPQESSKIKQKGSNKCTDIDQRLSQTDEEQSKSDLDDESNHGNEEHFKFLFDIKKEIVDSDDKLIESNECKLNTEDDDNLTASKKRELNDKVCTSMSKTATTVSRIEENEIHRKTQRSILCALCDMSVATQKQMKRHLKLVHTFVAEERQLYKCTYKGCSKVFSRLPNCKKHIDGVHLNLRNFMCEVCKFKFKTASSLRMHTVARHPVDEDRKMFKCQVCEKTFLRKAGLQLHESLHTNIKSYTCGFKGCGKSFRLKSNLTKHVKVHADVRNYHCNKCEERFSRKIYLETHMYKHTGVKAFQCDVCQKSYTQKGNLMTHKVLHTRERTVFNCPKCYQTFNFKSNMTKHLRQHDLLDVSKINATGTMKLSNEFKEVENRLFKIRPKLKKDRGMDGSFVGVSKNLEKGSAHSPESVELTGASSTSKQQKYFVSPSIFRAIEDNRNTKSVILMIKQYDGHETGNISEKIGLKTIKSDKLGKLIAIKVATGGCNEGALVTGEAENEKDATDEAQVNLEELQKSVACNTEENTTDNLTSYEIDSGPTKQSDNRNTTMASICEVVCSSELSEITEKVGYTSEISRVHAEEFQSNGNAINSQGSNEFTTCGKTESLTNHSNTEKETGIWNTVSAYTAVPVKEFNESGATKCECISDSSADIETSQGIRRLQKSVIANIEQERIKENNELDVIDGKFEHLNGRNDYVVTESAIIFQPESVQDNEGVGESNRNIQNVNDRNEYVEIDSRMLSTIEDVITPDSKNVKNLLTRSAVNISVADSNVNARFIFVPGPLDSMNILNQAAVGEEAPVTHLKETVNSPSNDFVYYNTTVTESQTISYGQLVSDFVQTKSSTSENTEVTHGETQHTLAALSDETDNLAEAGFISQISVGQQNIVQNVNPFDHDESIPESEIQSTRATIVIPADDVVHEDNKGVSINCLRNHHDQKERNLAIESVDVGAISSEGYHTMMNDHVLYACSSVQNTNENSDNQQQREVL